MIVKPGPNATKDNMYYVPVEEGEEARLSNDEVSKREEQMNLYFIDADGKQYLVYKNVIEEKAWLIANIDLADRRPDFISTKQRTWKDVVGRLWIDYGADGEFYILQKPSIAVNVVEDKIERKGCLPCRIKHAERMMEDESK